MRLEETLVVLSCEAREAPLELNVVREEKGEDKMAAALQHLSRSGNWEKPTGAFFFL